MLADNDPYAERELVIAQVRHEAEGVVSLRLVDPGGKELPVWTPGAHIDLLLPSGLVRQYSLCGSPSDRTAYTVAVLRDDCGRGGSLEIHDTARVGSQIRIRGPRNHFKLTPAPEYVFIAGGIGITPIRPMIEAAEAVGASWVLHYGGRTRGHMAFADTIYQRYPGRVCLVPQDTHGMLDLPGVIDETSPDAHVYACGPEPMLDATERVCAGASLARSLRIERFGARASATDHPRTASAFEVELRRTGLVLTVPADRSILSMAREVVPDMAYSCQEGVCGACEATVLEGQPDHRDSILTEEEREASETMMICVGRSLSPRLVLDL